jgi:intraflagellar transport protein 80
MWLADEDIVTAVGWSAANELFSIGDDHSVMVWDMAGDHQKKVCELAADCHVTDMHWFPLDGQRKGNTSDFMALACTDGTFKFLDKSGKIKVSVAAHTGAVVALRWNLDGTALATCGEDGVVKEWSRSGEKRSTLAETGTTVYSLQWSPEGQHLLYTINKQIIIKPMQPSAKQMQWNAHDGIVLCTDWNPVNGLILSGGEDCKYKVWDSYGRLLYQSTLFDNTITSVGWRPDGELFAVGSYNTIAVCDKRGWAHSREKTKSGSVLKLSWTSDGTQLSGAGANGQVVFGQLVDRHIEWGSFDVCLDENDHVKVTDTLKQVVEADQDFADRVTEISIGFGVLLVCTARADATMQRVQCYVYAVHNLHTPHIIDLAHPVNLILQCENCFLLVDNVAGIRVFSYEGHQLSNPKCMGLRPEFLNKQNLSLSKGSLALVDRNNPKKVLIFDPMSGKEMGGPIIHMLEITEIALDQYGLGSERKLAVLDRNHDLYLTPIHHQHLVKIANMVDSFLWHTKTDMLSASMDQQLCTWYYPNVVYVDTDLIEKTRCIKDGAGFGKNPQLVKFSDTHVTIRRSDGALVCSSISPFPSLLYEYVENAQWDAATKLCRFVKDKKIWACLGAMAINGQMLDTAEIAFAAIDEVDKLQYILYIKDIPSAEGVAAELALFRRRPEEAEQILLTAGLHYRAIKLNIKLFNWERALDLAVRNQVHVDTVLGYRQRYLTSFNKEETSQSFLQHANVIVDWEAIKAKITEEKEAERRR